ncbi:unnamed protein product [Linum tenue]|uniref:Uncharacterized protein n=1 Tax=Linum tenue TaxID=586396 RepID=A0AAV0RPS3_9ROSI|nr:unnamed protein product [Linum tenue]
MEENHSLIARQQRDRGHPANSDYNEEAEILWRSLAPNAEAATPKNATSSNSSGVWRNPGISESGSLLQPKDDECGEFDNTLDTLAAELFNEKISIQKKLKLFNRLATIKEDGTVQFEVPGHIEPRSLELEPQVFPEATDDESVDTDDMKDIPPLQIVMLIVGTRGDVQPFVAIGKRFQEDGHRVRLATHSNFKDFVLDAGLEFFPLGGDAKLLASYMVKNKGFLPSEHSEIMVQRQQMREIIFSLYAACKDPDPQTSVRFKADAIIANPPAYGHTHVAELLKVPLHMIFTIPWTRVTSEFPHPFTRVKQPAAYRVMSINFHQPVEEPEKMTEVIVRALELTGQRGIINKGWGGLGNLAEPKKYVYSLDSCPHDWLFLRCKAVVHHGGAGTTAAGLKAACPTTIVPFFGDQYFWGEQVHGRGVGPAPIPVDDFSTEKLVYAIKYMMDPRVKLRAVELAKAMENEDGVTGAVKAFYKHFPMKKIESASQPEPHNSKNHSRFSIRKCFRKS